jgi:hypothetical protein
MNLTPEQPQVRAHGIPAPRQPSTKTEPYDERTDVELG